MNNSTVSIDSGAPAADADALTIPQRRATFVSDGKGKSVKYVKSEEGEQAVINLNDFPTIKEALEELDVDGDGQVSQDELIKHLIGAKATKQKLHRSRWALATTVLAATSALVGISFASNKVAYETSKETIVEGTRLLTKSHEAVTTSANMIDVPIPAMAFLPDVVTSNINHVSFTSSEGTIHDREVAGVDTRAEEHVKIFTTLGDTIEWNGGSILDIAMAHGDSLSKSIKCSKCSAINLVMNDEIEQGLQEYERALDEIVPQDQDERRLVALSYGKRGILDIVSDCAQTCFDGNYSWGGLWLEDIDVGLDLFQRFCSCGSRDVIMNNNNVQMAIGPIILEEGTDDVLAYRMRGSLGIVPDCAQECFNLDYSWGGLWLQERGFNTFHKTCYCSPKDSVINNSNVQTVIGPIVEETMC